MKHILTLAIIMASITQNIFAQNKLTTKTSALLTAYYGIKNALVAGDASDANLHASQMVEAIHEIDSLKINADTRDEILVDATYISKSKDIHHLRDHFARLSSNIFAVAKNMKLSEQPIYYDYCPMKKSYWLSSTASIKNPYFGSQMLTCGTISETIK